MSKNVIFVSCVHNPYTSGTSTDIMTENLLRGIKMVCHNVIFAAVISHGGDANNIFDYYSDLADKVIVIESVFKKDPGSKYDMIIRTLYDVTFGFIGYDINEVLENIDDTWKMVVHLPSFDAIPICKGIKKKYPNIHYIQYWSDPYTLSGIMPEQLSHKRTIHYLLERNVLVRSDEIVYGTKTLMDFQQKIFKKYAKKMRYVDVAYRGSLTIDINTNTLHKKKIFGYTGNYYSSVRNIIPLYEAFADEERAELIICGSGDVDLQNTKSIEIMSRRPQNEIADIENNIDIMICLLNHSCIQIPGKLFYNANSTKPILVILDGKYSDEIKEYLSSFKRFEFCENNKESIQKAVSRIIEGKTAVDLSEIEKLSPQSVARQLINF